MRSLPSILGVTGLLALAALTGCGSPSASGSDESTASVESPLEATGGVQFYVTITGEKQGKFPGEATVAAYKGQIPAFQFLMGASEPSDVASGLPTGRVQLEDVKITKAWGESDPMILEAMTTNEVLTSVVLTFVKTTAGKTATWQTVTLTNARLDDVERGTLQLQDAAQTSMLADYLSFTYQKITVTDASGKTWSDDWQSPTAAVVAPIPGASAGAANLAVGLPANQ